MKVALAIAGVLAVMVVLVVAMGGGFLSFVQQAQQSQTAAGGDFSDVANAALELQGHIFGSRSNQYNDKSDTFMQRVMSYWATYCPGTGTGGICALAQSGNLQCVQFVTAAYWLGGDPLTDHPDAVMFWQNYANKPGWQQIPSPSADPSAPKEAPHLGDLMVFRGGTHLEQGKMVEYGHIGIVVNFTAPSASQNGSIEIAQANGPGTKFPPQSNNPWVASDKPGNTYMMTVRPDYRIDTWGPYSLDGVEYSGMTVLGFLHHVVPPRPNVSGQLTANAQSLPAGLSFAMPYVREAWDDAVAAGIPPGYYVRQINQESGFNPSALSPAGAQGIAQFMPATAAGIPNPQGAGMLNPWDPHQALIAGARYMARALQKYSGDYAKALAAYNGGDGAVNAAETAAANAGNGSTWLDHLVPETRYYIQVIMGI
jgi:hypothetical protein